MTMDEASNNIEAGRQHWLAPLMLQVLMGAALLSATAAVGCASYMLDGEGFLAAALDTSHGTLLAIWITWAGRASPWRFAMAYVVLVAGIAGWPSWLQWDNFAWLTILQTVVASLAFVVLRFSGIEIGRHIRVVDAAGEAPRQWIQFSLTAMLEWTAGVAVVLAASHYLPDWPTWDDTAVVLALLLLLAFVSTSTLWALLGTRWRIARTLALFAVATVASAVFWKADAGPDFWGCVGFMAVHVGYLAIMLGIVRWLGYRLVWRRRVWI